MEDVARAIEALHNVHNPDQLRDASQWLNAFSETNEAWEISITLLVPERPAPVQFFAANMLLAKVRRDWGRLSPDNRTAVSTAIRFSPSGSLECCQAPVSGAATNQRSALS